MVRPWREEVKGGYYHLIARGNNREYIFKKDIDKSYFLKLLNNSRQTMRYKLKYAEKAQDCGYTLREIGAYIGQSGDSIWKLQT